MIWDEKTFVFVIGAPRSGTTFLQAMLGSHPAIASTVELTVFDRYVAPWQKAWDEESSAIREGRWTRGLPHLWTEEEFQESVRGFMETTYRKLLAKNPAATVLVDKQPLYSHHVALIRKWIPGARFLHMVRDGRDVAASLVAAWRDRGFGAETVRDAARVWRDCYHGARTGAEFGPGTYHEVRYEALTEDGSAALRGIMDFCGIPCTVAEADAMLEAHRFDVMKSRLQTADRAVRTGAKQYRRGKSGGWREDLGFNDRWVFEEEAGALLVSLGYATDGWWKEGVAGAVLRRAMHRQGGRLKRAVNKLLRSAAGTRVAGADEGGSKSNL